MTKKYAIFSIETNDSIIHMEVNKSLYKAYQFITIRKKSNARFNDITTIKTKTV